MDDPVLDERGEPVVVELVGPASYLAGGRFGGVGRYQWATSAAGALALWAAAARGVGWFLPRRVRRSDEGPGERPGEEEE